MFWFARWRPGDVQSHLTYEHEWVRLQASRLFGTLFAAESPANLADLAIAALSSGKNRTKSRREKGGEGATLGYLHTDVCAKVLTFKIIQSITVW